MLHRFTWHVYYLGPTFREDYSYSTGIFYELQCIHKPP